MASLRTVGRPLWVSVLASAILLIQPGSPAAHAQAQSDDPIYDERDLPSYDDDIPAHIAIVDGAATLERDGRVETAEENVMLLAGDRLRTERGRVEVLFADGSALDLDEYTSVDLLSESLVRLLDGRLRLSIARTSSDFAYRVDAAPASVLIKSAGDYRIALAGGRTGDRELDLTVFRGSAELANDLGRTLVRAGTHAVATARLAPSLPYAANSAYWDEFDRWAETQRDARLGVQSARYLPAEVRQYGGAFDRYGWWQYEPVYGYVWYPRVHSGWRPYHHGRWSFTGLRFGWFWIGFDRWWGWPTHHYGRWGHSSSRWFWIPGRRWGPAWVSWATSPRYVGWCPLGFDNRPVFSIINVRHVSPWHGWTVMPSRAFGHNVLVTKHAIADRAFPDANWSSFAVRRAAPSVPVAAARQVEPLRAPSATAVRRTASPGQSFAAGAVPSGSGSAGTGSSPSRIPASSRPAISGSAPAVSNFSRVPRAEPRVGSAAPQSVAPSTQVHPSPADRGETRRAQPRATSRPDNPAPRPGWSPPLDYSPGRGMRSAPSERNEPPRAQPRQREPEPPPSGAPSRSFRYRSPESAPPPPPPSASESRRAPGPSRFGSGSPPPPPSSEAPRSSPGARQRSEPRTSAPPSSSPPPSAAPQRTSPGRSDPPPSGQAVRRGRGGDNR